MTLMMGYNHVTLGAIVGLATVGFVPDPTIPRQIMWVAGVAAFAQLPDLDCVGSSAARMWGPVSESVAGGISALAGGHRWGTHDLVLAPLAFGLLALVASLHPVGVGILLAFTAGLTLRALTSWGFTSTGALLNLACSVAIGWWAATHGFAAGLLPAIVALGVLAHILGDAPTVELIPVPVVWIWTKARFGVPLFRVGKWVELLVVTPLLGTGFVALLWIHAGCPAFDDAVQQVRQIVFVLQER